MRSEPIKHHYIPQFILRNFCFEEKRLYYFDKQTGRVSAKDPRDIFVERNLYRDEINSADDPVKIEKELSRYEGEVAKILKERFLDAREILLTPEENAKLMLFLAIMGFRSLQAKRSFDEGVTKRSKAFYRAYQPDGNILDMWKRNLGHIVQCRSFEEVWDHPGIDDPMKLFIRRDVVGLFGKYIAVAEANAGNSFLIGDIYPVVITGIGLGGLPAEMYEIFPISPNRVLFLANNGMQGTPRDVLFLRDFLFQPPKRIEETKQLRVRVRKLCTEEVLYLNKEIAETAKQGVAFRHMPSASVLREE